MLFAHRHWAKVGRQNLERFRPSTFFQAASNCRRMFPHQPGNFSFRAARFVPGAPVRHVDCNLVRFVPCSISPDARFSSSVPRNVRTALGCAYCIFRRSRGHGPLQYASRVALLCAATILPSRDACRARAFRTLVHQLERLVASRRRSCGSRRRCGRWNCRSGRRRDRRSCRRRGRERRPPQRPRLRSPQPVRPEPLSLRVRSVRASVRTGNRFPQPTMEPRPAPALPKKV